MGRHSIRVGAHSIFSPMSKLLFAQRPATDKVLAETDYIEKGGSKDVIKTYGNDGSVIADVENDDSIFDEDGQVTSTKTNNHGLHVTEKYTVGK